MKKFKIPCTWQMYGFYHIEAENLKEALEKAVLALTSLAMEEFKQEQDRGLTEGLADDFMKMAQDKGYNARRAGTPEQERERSQQILAQRAQELHLHQIELQTFPLAQLRSF